MRSTKEVGAFRRSQILVDKARRTNKSTLNKYIQPEGPCAYYWGLGFRDRVLGTLVLVIVVQISGKRIAMRYLKLGVHTIFKHLAYTSTNYEICPPSVSNM